MTFTADGTAGGQASTTNKVTFSMNTARTDDIVFIGSGCEVNSGSPPSISSISVTGAGSTITWHLRKSFINGTQAVESWWGHAPTSLSPTVSVTINYTGNFDDAAVVAFAVNGCNLTAPFDTNAALPATAANARELAISTTSSSAFVLILSCTPINSTSSSWVPNGVNALITNRNNAGGINFENTYLSGAAVSSAQSAVTWGSATTPGTSWYTIGDALAPPGSPQLTGLIASTSSVAGSVTANTLLSGTVVAVSTVSGGLSAPADISGAIGSDSSVAGSLTAPALLTGTSASTSMVSGLLSVSVDIAGTISSASSVSGALTAASLLTSRIDSVSTASGSLAAPALLSGASSSSSTVSGTITTSSAPPSLSGLVASVSTVTGTLSVPVLLTGIVASESTVSGTLSIYQYLNLWPIKQAAFAYERGHSSGMTLPGTLNL